MTIPDDAKKIAPRMVVVITTAEDGKKIEKFFNLMKVPIWNQCRGKGTAPSEMMDIFGLSGTTRLLTYTFVSRECAKELMRTMSEKLSFKQRGGGIAISIPVTGIQSNILNILNDEKHEGTERCVEERSEKNMDGAKEMIDYVVIWVSAARGYSDDVVDAAREAGARGGTVIKGRRHTSDRVSGRLGLPTQEEQDFVMIVAPKAKKSRIMSAISDKCGLNTPAHSVVLSLPVDDAIGLEV